MNKLNTVNTWVAGASRETCKLGGSPYPFDPRSYAAALSETGFPLLSQWIEGYWTTQSKTECLQFIKKAIAHGSFSMIAVACLALTDSPVVSEILELLTEKETARFNSLLRIGSEIDEHSQVIKAYCDQEKRREEASNGQNRILGGSSSRVEEGNGTQGKRETRARLSNLVSQG